MKRALQLAVVVIGALLSMATSRRPPPAHPARAAIVQNAPPALVEQPAVVEEPAPVAQPAVIEEPAPEPPPPAPRFAQPPP